PADRARGPEANDRPVVPWASPPLRFPPIGHVTRLAGQDQIVPGAEEHVAARDDKAAMLDSRQVDVAALPQPIPVWRHLAMYPEPGDAAVGKDAQAHMRRSCVVARRQ